jgi:WD40 repeat protein
MRKFRGHTDQVTNISMSPADDTFLSSSKDRTVRLWTAQSAGCLAELPLPDKTEKDPIAAFDSTGLVFAVTAPMKDLQGHHLHLYDVRQFNVVFCVCLIQVYACGLSLFIVVRSWTKRRQGTTARERLRSLNSHGTT